MADKNNYSQIPLKKILRPLISPALHLKLNDSPCRLEHRRPHPDFDRLLKAFEDKNLEQVLDVFSSGLDINYSEPARDHRTPILYAAKFNFVEAVNELIQRGANTESPDDNGITPLHVAASHACLQPLLKLIKAKVNPNAVDKHGRTPLHFATRTLSDDKEDNPINIIRVLLKSGAKVLVADENKRSPLHCAALVGNANVIPLLIRGAGKDLILEKDKYGQTALHLAVIGARSIHSVKILLNHGANIDARNHKGRTPVHYAAGRPINFVDEEFDGECLELLLSRGASVNSKDNNGYNALSLALQRTMWWNRQTPKDTISYSVQLLVAKGSAIIDSFDMWRIVETFPSLVVFAMNQSIRASTSVKDSPLFKLTFDFRPLTVNTRLLAERKRLTFNPSMNVDETPIPQPLLVDSEISMLHYIFWAGHKNILSHPLCSAFLHMKWLKVRKFFVINVLAYIIFVLTLSAYIIVLHSDIFEMKRSSDTNIVNSTEGNNARGGNQILGQFLDILWHTLIIFNIICFIKEFVQIAHSPLIYLRRIENYVDILIIVCVVLLLTGKNYHSTHFQRYVGTTALISCWARLMFFLGQFPSCGVYIVMFSSVCTTVLKFLAMYVPLLIAFAFGFFILFNEHSSFQKILTSFVTTVIMMVGEIEYDDKILNNDLLPSKIFPCFILILFLLLIYIILSNLLVALAVNDLNAIQQKSELLRLTRQVELMVTVESFLNSPFFPSFLSRHLRKMFSVTNRAGNPVVAIHPNKKYGFIEKAYLKLYSLCRCHKILIKVFEQFFVNFIPPVAELSLPPSILQEAIQLSTNELEIEKRDKFLLAKSHGTNSIRNRRVYNRKARYQANFMTENIHAQPTRNSLWEQANSKEISQRNETADIVFPRINLYSDSNLSRPSMRTSVVRADFGREAFLHPKKIPLENEYENGNEELNELKAEILNLQKSISNLATKFTPVIESDSI